MMFSAILCGDLISPFPVLVVFSGCRVTAIDGTDEMYDGCVIAAHAPDALNMLGTEATYEESRILGAFQYVYR